MLRKGAQTILKAGAAARSTARVPAPIPSAPAPVRTLPGTDQNMGAGPDFVGTPGGQILPASAPANLQQHADNPAVRAAASAVGANPSADHIVNTVHGTRMPWQSPATWPDPSSDFSQAVVQGHPSAVVQSVPWSGANSHEERLESGAVLAASLQAQQMAASMLDRSVDQSVVAHSHGGNVAKEADRILGEQREAGAAHSAAPSLMSLLGTPHMSTGKWYGQREPVYGSESTTPVDAYSGVNQAGDPSDMVQGMGAATFHDVPVGSDRDDTVESLSTMSGANVSNIPVPTPGTYNPGAHKVVRSPAVAEQVRERTFGGAGSRIKKE